MSVESLSFSSDRVIVLVTDPNHPGRSPTVTLGMITEKKTTLIATKIMEYLRFKKKSICSRTIHLKYSTSWLYLARLDLVRVFHLFQITHLMRNCRQSFVTLHQTAMKVPTILTNYVNVS